MNRIEKIVSAGLSVVLVFACAGFADAQTTRTRTPRTPPATKSTPRTPKAVAPKPTAPPRQPAPKPEPKTDDAPAPKTAEPPAPPPAAKAEPAKPGASATTTPEDLGPKTETDPAVLTALQTPRKTPRDYLQAIMWLIDLGRPELAKPIMADLAKMQITDEQRIELVAEFGSSSMLKLARTKDLAPAGIAFSHACMAAASTVSNNPQRMTTIINQLADPSAEVRTMAQHDLAAMGQPAATATLETFARETVDRRAALANAILMMRPFVEGPLLAMLDTSDAVLRADVARLLLELKVPRAQPLLIGPNNAERELTRALHSYAQGTPVATPDASNHVEMWQWNDATKQLTATRLPADDARIIWMSKLARALAQLRPQNADYQQRALVLSWEAASLTAATPPSTVNTQQQTAADARVLNGVLAEALKENAPHAAITAVNALGQRGDLSVLITGDGKPAPLVDALASPNRSVRFAALRAIMALDPTSPYPGSSRVPEALAWFAGSSDTRRAIAAMPTIAAAGDLAGLLVAQNLTPEATNRGRDAVNMAIQTPDLEAIFVDLDIIVPGIRDVLYELRTNATTGEVPIAILAAEGRLDAAKRLAAEHHRVIAVPRPHSPEVVANTVKQLADLSARDVVPATERVAQASQAQAWLAKLESGSRPFYVIRRTALLQTNPLRTTPPAPLPNR